MGGLLGYTSNILYDQRLKLSVELSFARQVNTRCQHGQALKVLKGIIPWITFHASYEYLN